MRSLIYTVITIIFLSLMPKHHIIGMKLLFTHITPFVLWLNVSALFLSSFTLNLLTILLVFLNTPLFSYFFFYTLPFEFTLFFNTLFFKILIIPFYAILFFFINPLIKFRRIDPVFIICIISYKRIQSLCSFTIYSVVYVQRIVAIFSYRTIFFSIQYSVSMASLRASWSFIMIAVLIPLLSLIISIDFTDILPESKSFS